MDERLGELFREMLALVDEVADSLPEDKAKGLRDHVSIAFKSIDKVFPLKLQ